MSLTDVIIKKYKQDISEFVLLPSRGGCFEVKIDDELIFSKLKEKRFPEHEEILAKLPPL